MAKTPSDASDATPSAADRVREELSKFLTSQVEHLAEKAGSKLTDLTGQLTGISENGGALPKIASRLLKGESPVKAIVSEKAKDAKDNVMGKVKEAFGGGSGGGGSAGKNKVTSVIEVLDIGLPLRTVYDHWTAYDKFNEFTKGVSQVSPSDEVESDWKVKIAFSNRSFKATVQEQVPDERIVWTSEGSKGSTRGVVSFHELAPALTRVVLVIEYYPSGFFEKTGNLWRAQGRRMRLDFKHFQRYVTFTDEEPEAWRGEIRDGEVVRTHEEVTEEEEAAQEDDGYDEDEDEDDEDGAYEDGEEEDEDADGDDDEYDDDDDDEEDDDEDELADEKKG
ncbi:SRPBCC family protein [Streptomyces sp. NBC_01497]|uniref:SRPBCC family protein n=1 Tax=Streptomyces sp. NBC_01497 TaxID=2903885 RepID=UPI002E323F56|nr:SRPBCC family protein [Streptomyces sp. NBC_01497]